MIAMNLKYLHQWSVRSMGALALVVLFCVNATGAEDYLSDASYEDQAVTVRAPDPIEPFNRAMFTFNDKLYLWVLDPVATGYSKVLPADIRVCIGNFFYNVGEPVRSVNFLLQGRFRDSGLTLSRFAINSIAGVFGLADPAADEFKMSRKRPPLVRPCQSGGWATVFIWSCLCLGLPRSVIFPARWLKPWQPPPITPGTMTPGLRRRFSAVRWSMTPRFASGCTKTLNL